MESTRGSKPSLAWQIAILLLILPLAAAVADVLPDPGAPWFSLTEALLGAFVLTLFGLRVCRRRRVVPIIAAVMIAIGALLGTNWMLATGITMALFVVTTFPLIFD